MPNANQQLRTFQEAMDAADYLPPAELNGTPPDEPTLTDEIRRRNYAEDQRPDSNILTPIGWR